jgi:hypothetical protein
LVVAANQLLAEVGRHAGRRRKIECLSDAIGRGDELVQQVLGIGIDASRRDDVSLERLVGRRVLDLDVLLVNGLFGLSSSLKSPTAWRRSELALARSLHDE